MRRQRAKQTACYRAFVDLKENQRKPLEEILAINWEKRHQLLLYAFRTIPFYKARYQAAGFQEKDFADPAVWDSLPILTRKDLVERFDEVRAPDLKPGDFSTTATGGTTGHPVKVLHDLRFPNAAIGWRALEWWGIGPGLESARIGRFTAAELEEKKGGASRKTGGVRLPVSHMDEESVRLFVDDWNRARPPLLAGYVGGIHLVACYIRDHGLRVHRPIAIQTTTAPLSAVHRAIIEAAFQAPVYDQYGSCEVYWMAAECRLQKGLHIFADARHIEFAGEDGRACPPDEYGRILVTDLENRAFPLIRYENGDRGRLLSRRCTCGVNLPLMDSVKGRLTDAAKFKDGTVIDGVYLTTIFDDCPEAVSAFQVRQNADYSIDLVVVPNRRDPRTKESVQAVLAKLMKKVPAGVPVRVAEVADIPFVRGKTKYVVSDVPK